MYKAYVEWMDNRVETYTCDDYNIGEGYFRVDQGTGRSYLPTRSIRIIRLEPV